MYISAVLVRGMSILEEGQRYQRLEQQNDMTVLNDWRKAKDAFEYVANGGDSPHSMVLGTFSRGLGLLRQVHDYLWT